MWLINKDQGVATLRDDFLTSFINEIGGDYMNQEQHNNIQIRDKKDNVKVFVALPGFHKKDIQVSYKEGYLYIEADVKNGSCKKKADDDHDEYFVNQASHSVYVGKIDFEKANAEYINGVLMVQLPKVAPRKPVSLKIN